LPLRKLPSAFGRWPSPISAACAATASRRFGTLQADADAIYWTESRPEQQGRQVIMRADRSGGLEELLPQPFSARSRVHEYGGGEFHVADGVIYFVNDSNQQIYRLDLGGAATRVSNAPGTRFADLALDAPRARLIAIAEIHAREASGARPRNVLVAVALCGAHKGRIIELASGRDFYASPRLSPDGTRLAYLAWDLPDMPWDSAALNLARLGDDGALLATQRIAGGAGSAAFQPEWSRDGDLYFVSDASGWGALQRWRNGKSARVAGARGLELMRPQWVFCSRSYAIGADGTVACAYLERGGPRLEFLGLPSSRKGAAARTGTSTRARLAASVTRVDDPLATDTGFAALVSASTASPSITRITRRGATAVAAERAGQIARGYLSRGEARQFRSSGRHVHGFYYAPANARHRGPPGAAPPALIFVHGGPTAMADPSLKMRIQYFTSRGFAVFDVNYSGSTGYGRAYRQRLDGAWGIADVADCVAAARHLAATGSADRGRIAIAGGSAGGYTTLMALATSEVFAAGSSHYGICDLKLLLAHTHKFEAGYLHRLMGTTARQWQGVFAARSPLNLVDRITAPVILFQGLEDRVVPAEQSLRMAEGLRARGIDVAYHAFPGEGHGFRRASTIAAVLEAELDFLCRALRLP
jgi:dipeptidyl aminopeptidase/acylaminoacyl peptidase